VYFPLISYTTNYRRTLLVSDYITFDVYQAAGSLSTSIGVLLTYGDATTSFYALPMSSLNTGLNTWTSYSAQITAPDVGKTLAQVSAGMGAPGATGSHIALVRRVRITDQTGTLRKRLFTGTETRLLTSTPSSGGNYSSYTGFGSPSRGTTFTWDATRKRFDGTKSNRWLRAKLTFYNKTDLASLYISTQPAGTE
jgi:hypothetical protein